MLKRELIRSQYGVVFREFDAPRPLIAFQVVEPITFEPNFCGVGLIIVLELGRNVIFATALQVASR